MSYKEKINFEYIFQRGKKEFGKYLIIYQINNDYEKIRAGIIVSRKVGKAVIRNRIKRIIREAIININKNFNINKDIIIISKHINGKNNKLNTTDMIKDLSNILNLKGLKK